MSKTEKYRQEPSPAKENNLYIDDDRPTNGLWISS